MLSYTGTGIERTMNMTDVSDIDPHIFGNLMQDKCDRALGWIKVGAEKLVSVWKKLKWYLLHIMQKLNFKWIKDLNMKDEILTSLEQNIGEYDWEERRIPWGQIHTHSHKGKYW